MRNVYQNTYFKQGKNKISGIHLSVDMIKNTVFIECDFHPNTFNLEYEDCIFIECQMKGMLTLDKGSYFIEY